MNDRRFHARDEPAHVPAAAALPGLGCVALNSLLGPRLRPPDRVPAVVAGRREPAALHAAKAKRVIFLYMAGGPSHLETFDYKPKLAEMHGKPMPESFTKGQPIAQLQGAEADVLRAAARLQEVRQVGPGDLRAVPAHRQRRRRHLHRPLDADRADQPRPGAHVHEHRHRPSPAGRAWARGCSTAWARRRRTCPASSCCVSTGQRRPDAADRRAAVVGRLPAEPVPGRPASARKGDPVLYLDNPPGVDAGRSSATSIDAVNAAQPAARRDRRRPRDRDAHRAVRDGVQDADERARS